MSARQYVLTTTLFKPVGWSPEWKVIPKDHRDPEVKKYFPGKFCYHPDAEITFIFRTRR